MKTFYLAFKVHGALLNTCIIYTFPRHIKTYWLDGKWKLKLNTIKLRSSKIPTNIKSCIKGDECRTRASICAARRVWRHNTALYVFEKLGITTTTTCINSVYFIKPFVILFLKILYAFFNSIDLDKLYTRRRVEGVVRGGGAGSFPNRLW